MSQIEVPDWVAADVLSRYSALRIERGDGEPWPPELASQQRQEDMRTALNAALGAWVVPVACARPHDIHEVDVGNEMAMPMWNLKYRGTTSDFTLYVLRQEKPE